MYKKLVWPVIVFLTIGLMVTFIIGFGVSISISRDKGNLTTNNLVAKEENTDTTFEEIFNADEISETTSETIDHELKYKSFYEVEPNILVLGDSIGYGFGDDNNSGIGNRYADLIDLDTNTNPVYNLSVSGDEILDLRLIVNNIDNEKIIADMDLIIISIGGNDLNRISYTGPVDLELNYLETLNMYKEELNIILTRILSLNSDVQLALVGLYDPFVNNEQKTKLLLNWNYETSLLLQDYDNIVYVPTYENFQLNLSKYLAFDDFHPGPEGYEYIANELYGILHSHD